MGSQKKIRPRKPLPSGAVLGALTSAKGHPRRICLDDPGIIVDCLESLTSALERPIRNPTSRTFASEVFHDALTSAKGRSRRSCLDDLSRHSRPPHIVDICDKASDVKHANANRKSTRSAVNFSSFFNSHPQRTYGNLCSAKASPVRMHNTRCRTC